MANFKGAKRSLLMSALALVLCVSMLIGSTFAWFTDTATTGVNKIQSGTLDVELLMLDGGEWVNAENKTLNFLVADADGNTTMGTNILWEPGCTYELPQLKVVNKGNLALKYQIHITGIEGDAKLLEVIDFTVEGEDALTGTLAPQAETAAITLIGHMDEQAGNDYQNLTLDAISITVVATQLAAEFDSLGNDYDQDAWHPAMKVYNANDLQSAINNGETNIVLEDDITLTESIVIPAAASTYSLRAAANAITINLNGKTISTTAAYDDANASASSALVNNGVLVLTGNGTIKAANNYTVRNYGTMIIDGVSVENGIMNFADLTVESGDISNSRTGKHTIYGNNAKLVINGGTFHNDNPGNATIFSYAGEVEINGGEFTIADGTATQGWTSCLLDAQGGAKFVITGGTINGEIRDYNNNTVVTGGTFTHNSVEKFLAEGYTAVTNSDGTLTVLFPQESFDDLLEDAVAGDTVEIPAGNFTFPTDVEAGVTLECAPGTVFEGSTALSGGVNVNGATFSNPEGTAVTSTVNGTFTDCTFSGTNGLRWCYAGETVVFVNCVFDGDVYGVHFDGGANEVKFINCTFSGFNALGGAITQVTMEGCTFVANGRSNYNGINMWGNTTMTDCTFIFDGTAGNEWIDACGSDKTYSFTDCVVTDGVNETPIATVIGDYGTGNTIIVDGEAVVYTVSSLKAALSEGLTEINIAGEITLTEGLNASNVTFVGASENAAINFAGHNIGGSGTITYKDLTLSTISLPYGPTTGERYGWYGGIDYNGHSVSNYENCTISGVFTTYSSTVNVTDCTFLPYIQDGEEFYHIFVYGSSEVNVEGGTFYYGDRAIKIYNEGGVKDVTLNISGSTFTAAEGATVNKALINVDTSYMNSVKLNIEGITVDSALAGVETHNCDGNAKVTVTIQ